MPSSVTVPLLLPVIVAVSLVPVTATVIVSVAVPSTDLTVRVSDTVSPPLSDWTAVEPLARVYPHSPVVVLKLKLP